MIVAKFQTSLVPPILVWLLSYALIIYASSVVKEQVNDNNETTCSSVNEVETHCRNSQKLRVPDDCTLVYAKVPVDADRGKRGEHEWATYTMLPRKKGTPVRRYGDVVIQWTDPTLEPLKSKSIGRMLRRLTWNGQETGGQYEGIKLVESVVTGIGFTARSTTAKNTNNILPLVPRVDEGSLTRFDSPGAGAVTSYHNYTWWFSKDIQAGDELVYFSEGKRVISTNDTTEQSSIDPKKQNVSLEYLRTNGYCMDNMRPQKSRIKAAGRGAFATRDLLNNSIVAPIPVALVHRDELLQPNRNDQRQGHQLLLNYCLGHKSSSWLLFPYTSVVNLINHYNEPNVELRWSTTSNSTKSIEEKSSNISFLELVALRPIKMGEEIFLDYGRDWEDSWWKHVRETWKPNNSHYTPSYVMDDAIKLIRTEQEQKDHPYPDNLFTSCFYRYSDRSEEERTTAKNSRRKDSITSFRWHLTKGLYDLKNLRPCRVLKRMEGESERSIYAVRMLNRPGLNDDEIIPEDDLHIVTHIPRAGIRFSDKAGTTDQHLDNAFRHEIGLPEDLIPTAWKVMNGHNSAIEKE